MYNETETAAIKYCKTKGYKIDGYARIAFEAGAAFNQQRIAELELEGERLLGVAVEYETIAETQHETIMRLKAELKHNPKEFQTYREKWDAIEKAEQALNKKL